MAFDFNKLNKREKTLLGVMLIAISTIPIFQFTIPAWNKYMETGTKIQQDQSKTKDLNTRIKNLENLKKENVEILKQIENQKSFIAKSYEIDFLVQDLKKICDESSITLESFTPTASEPINIVLEKQALTEIKGKSNAKGKLRQALDKLKGQDLPIDLYRFPIEVKVTGDFTDTLELFKKLETYGRVISVENISISKVQAKQTFGNRLSRAKPQKEAVEIGGLSTTFDLVAYSLPSSEETVSAAQLQQSLSSSMSSFKFKKNR